MIPSIKSIALIIRINRGGLVCTGFSVYLNVSIKHWWDVYWVSIIYRITGGMCKLTYKDHRKQHGFLQAFWDWSPISCKSFWEYRGTVHAKRPSEASQTSPQQREHFKVLCRSDQDEPARLTECFFVGAHSLKHFLNVHLKDERRFNRQPVPLRLQGGLCLLAHT